MMIENPQLRVTLTKQQKNALDELVDMGIYMNKGDAIRSALRLLYRFHGLKFSYLGAKS